MKNRITVFFAVILVGIFIVVSAYAAETVKIGVIDFQKVLKTSNAGKAAQAEVNKQGKKMEEELNKKRDELEELKKKLEREVLVMTREMRDEKEREFRIKVNDFKMLEKKYKEEFNEVNKKLVYRFRNEVVDLAKKVGEKEGYLLIIEKNEAGIVYSPDRIDLTDKIIKIYNEDYAKKP